MCSYITLVAPTDDAAHLDQFMRRFGRRADPIDGRSIAKALATGERQYLTTVRDCDCGTELGGRLIRQTPEEEARERERRVERLRAKGWSDAKIERSLADSSKPRAEKPESGSDYAFWAEVLTGLTGEFGLKQAGLLVHFYSGSIGSEAFDVRRRELPRGADVEAALADMQDDELLVVKRG